MKLTDFSVEELKRSPEKREEYKRVQEQLWSRLPESTRRGYFEFRGRQECSRKAQARPLPGESAGAFLNGAIDVCGKKVFRFVPAHFMILQKIESPLLEMIAEVIATKKATRDLTQQEQSDLCLIFTSNPKELLLNVIEAGTKAKEYLQKRSLEEVSLVWEQYEIEFVVNGIFEQYVRHALTKSKVLSSESEKGEVRFFQVPTTAAA